jgi:hypothetical protein
VSTPQSQSQRPAENNIPVPPAGEEIHLPPGSVLPLATAVGITLIVVGSTIDWRIWSVLGAVIFLVSVGLWIRDTRRELAHLPDEHGNTDHH